ncbi:tetratricopeptide repeat protein [Hymenobacter jejuensis]|uniref:Tetratricopeptide repeat protein n=1 Tax=Hymenobacter jejuensis TaxID=2502781 RepID=A0A5B8A5S6_9BACT|nr:tetratricopeptide repeat protein [Hymenobacter jejuensis]QDA62006.1 tetratricopeptide repeat protein [Hymenobacter jejuensis]
MENARLISRFALISLALLSWTCKEKKATPSQEAISSLHLKAGPQITCGPADQQFGTLNFATSCPSETQADFNLALKLLHSFEYEEAEKVFAQIIHARPDCAMAYWGVAMSNFHPLWSPPSEAELQKGAKAIALAQSLPRKSPKEAAYLEAIGAFYQGWNTESHAARCLAFEKAMEQLSARFPDDQEAAILHALALTAAADPSDTTFTKQKKAGAILTALYPKAPNHPGIIHYLIHAYDSPALAKLALPAARKYAAVAPSSAHALHMPSHIFTRLGLWDECLKSNLESVASAQCYAEATGIKGHWDEELHGMDYLMYAYLQKGDNALAKRQWDYLNTIREVHPANFKVAYAFAAIPSRYVLENKQWREAAALPSPQANFNWEEFPWQNAIVHFTRLLGDVHTDQLQAANTELQELKRLQARLTQQKDTYKAQQVQIQITTGEAWIRLKEGRQNDAVRLMTLAANLEDHTEKHPVTPGEVLPARELLGDMLMQVQQPTQALVAYEASLKRHPNRLNSLYGAGSAAEKAGEQGKASSYFRQLLAVAPLGSSPRPELTAARLYVRAQQ